MAVAIAMLAAGSAACSGPRAESLSSATPISPSAHRSVYALGASLIPVSQRKPLPAVSGPLLDGSGTSALRSLTAGKVAVVNVWASWCAPCREEAGPLATVSRAFGDVAFVGIDEMDTIAAARAFVSSAGWDYPQLSDPSSRILSTLVVLPREGIPSTLVVDRHGRMAGRIIGPVTTESLTQLVRTVQAEK